ncbi:tetratricopeptide repeat protein, partial [Escherichia coli]|uniref:tetratricopeptide repeat protein n=1 Tax=Escherichia coli TaxID=562 RepID=UPI0012BE25CD
ADKILKQNPQRYFLLVSKAYLESVAFELGDINKYKEAKESFEKAIKIAPYFPQVRLAYSKILMINKEIDLALKQIKEVLKLNPNLSEANYFYYRAY